MSFEIIDCKSTEALQETTHVAHIEHQCNDCPHPILPGDFYQRKVYLVKLTLITQINRGITKFKNDNKITVYKNHDFCPGDRYDEEEEEPIVDDISYKKDSIEVA